MKMPCLRGRTHLGSRFPSRIEVLRTRRIARDVVLDPGEVEKRTYRPLARIVFIVVLVLRWIIGHLDQEKGKSNVLGDRPSSP